MKLNLQIYQILNKIHQHQSGKIEDLNHAYLTITKIKLIKRTLRSNC